MIWKPNVVVAAVVERAGNFLLVEEHTEAGPAFNQPAGHLEPGETLLQGVVRETLEETGYNFAPRSLVGVYLWRNESSDTTFLRFAFSGEIVGHDPRRLLDDGIIRAAWLAPAEIQATSNRHRSPLVMQCVTDYLSGKSYPLELLHFHS